MFKLNKFIVKVSICCLSAMLLNSCAGIKAGTHYDEKYYFDGYKTFAWIDESPIYNDKSEAINISPLTLKKIVQSIQAELQSKGYHYIDNLAEADFALSYTVGSRETLSVDSFPVGFRHDWGWYWDGHDHAFDQWHIQSWTEGTLTIDIFDNSNKEPIWHGWATKTVTTSDRKDPTKAIILATAKIFHDFPTIK